MALAEVDAFEFADCLLVIPRREPRLFLLNPTARLMWQALAEGAAPADAIERIAARFAVPPARVQADMAAIVAEWQAHGLLSDAVAADELPPAAAAPLPQRQGFHAERTYRLCGRAIRIRIGEPAIDRAIHPPLAHALAASERPRDTIDVVRADPGYLVVCNGSDRERAATLEEALGQLFGRILELSYPEAEWLAMLHAAAVGDARGAVVMAGASGSGKSTLTAALVHAGLGYLSDDIVPLDAALRIRPLPLGISVKEGSWPVLATRYPELATLPVHAGRRRRYLPVPARRLAPGVGLPVKSLVFPTYRPDHPLIVRSLTPLEVLQRLTQARSWLSLDGRRFASTLRWIEDAPGYEFGYASLDEAVRVIDGLLGNARPQSDHGELWDG
jgi:Coenzyme PQQ synthesis protein D (PqqD)